MINTLKEKFISDKYFYTFLFLFMLLGVGLRLFTYFQQYSLHGDEASLACNIIDKNFYGLTFDSPLHFCQSAPVGFLYAEKIFFNLFGISELTFRFFPLLCGIASIPLFYYFAKEYLTKKSVLLAMFLFSISSGLVSYSNIVRHFSTEVFISLLLFVTIRHFFRKEQINIIIPFIVGGIAVFFSFSAIFILASLGIYFFCYFIIKKQKENIARLIVTGYIWLICFAISFAIAKNNLMIYKLNSTAYWSYAFMPLPPNLEWFISTLKDILHLLFLNEALVLIFLTIAGAILLAIQKKANSILLFLPLILVLIASSMQLYTASGRVVLFLTPIFIIFIAKSLDFADYLNNKVYKTILCIIISLAILLPIPFYKRNYLSTYSTTKLDKVFSFIEAKDDAIYVYHRGIITFLYYYYYADYKDKFPARDNIIFGTWDWSDANTEEKYNVLKKELDNAINNNKKIWFFFFQIKPNEVLAVETYLNENGHLLKAKEINGAKALLYEFD